MARTRYQSSLGGVPLSALPAAALRAVLREGYTRADLKSDLLAGLVVGLVALPLAMALAIAVGVPPQHGLYTAIVAGGLVAALVLIIRLEHVPAMDATGLVALESALSQLYKNGCQAILCGLQRQPAELLVRAGIVETLGRLAICADLTAAVAAARALVEPPAPPAADASG